MYYKLTDQRMRTHGDFQWKPGQWYTIRKSNRGEELCTKSWFHCCNNPLLAILLNPVHADIANPRLFRCNVRGMKREDNGLKFGFTQMRILEELEVPEISSTQRAAFGILCIKKICNDKSWNNWADNWLSGEDRTKKSANSVMYPLGSARGFTVAYAAYAANAAAYAARFVEYAVSVVARSAIEINLIALAKEAMKY